MSNLILYSTHCPLCMLLEKKLKDKNIEYIVNTNVGEMRELGFTSVPVLKVDDRYMLAQEAMRYIDNI